MQKDSYICMTSRGHSYPEKHVLAKSNVLFFEVHQPSLICCLVPESPATLPPLPLQHKPVAMAKKADLVLHPNLEHADLTKCHFANGVVFLGFYKLLDGHQLASLPVLAFHDQAIRTFPHYRNVLIFLHCRLSSSQGLTSASALLRSVTMLQSKNNYDLIGTLWNKCYLGITWIVFSAISFNCNNYIPAEIKLMKQIAKHAWKDKEGNEDM